MPTDKTNGWRTDELSAVSRLARFFPDATAVRIPISVSRRNHRAESEATVIEFGTPREVLFACRLPLEFADKVWLQNADGSLQTEAWIVAVQHQDGQAAVAARFAQEVANWVIKA